MKVTVNIDCTPEEARAFFGLPDLAPVHKAYVDKMESLMRDGVSATDVERMMRQWTQMVSLPSMSEGLETWQKAMWSAMGGNMGGKS
jgi:hypothetical protein